MKELVRFIASFIKQEIGSLCFYIFPVSLSGAERQFVKENSAFWSKYTSGCPGDRYVLIEFNQHPVIYLSNASFGSIVAFAKGLRPLFLLWNHEKAAQRKILESYPNAAFVYLIDWRYLLPNIRAWFEAKEVYRSLKTPEDLLKLKVDDISVGDTVYDAVLSSGYATIRAIDGKVFKALYAFFRIRCAIKDIIRRYKIETAVVSQLMGLNGGTLGKYLIKSGIEVLNRVGSYQILGKKYRALNDLGSIPISPTPEYFKMLMNNDDGTIEGIVEEYLEKRLSGGVTRLDAAQAFAPMKKTFTDRQSFCAEYQLDFTKPIIFVMLHAFNDNPHWNYPKKMLFLDYYHWFMRTLEITKKVDSVNWVFKEHPTQRFYPVRDLNVKAIMEQVNFDHIRFIDGQANFNTGSLHYLAHAIVTGAGTAGLEFAAYGIPCVLAGEGAYSGFGFTVEPQTVEEYEACLRHIDCLKPLRGIRVKAAKMVAYLYFTMSESQTYYFCPYFEGDTISDWKPEHSESLWRTAAANFQDQKISQEMINQVNELSGFICDSSRVLYLDLSKYKFLIH